ncbi:hypothetical protein B0H34DRAFT_701607 [Crassisporium funariophilum]|nr:hypothetical protein B0H34DRAFT_701607 [Crassisporium funariophilum]
MHYQNRSSPVRFLTLGSPSFYHRHMPLDHKRDTVFENVEDDDMPPLVDNPNPSLTYTFFSRMTPLSFTSTSAPTAAQDISPQTSASVFSSPPPSPITPDEPTSTQAVPMLRSRPHGKHRDPSYIPRPPNAFILFRSAFIRDRNVPGQVEGNHSNLSKIIGHCWKMLTPEEREKWEAEAVLALADHRAKYPDWRFRPGANAMAKLKVKDGGTVTRRRSVRTRVKDSSVAEAGGDDDFVVVDAKGKAKDKAKGKKSSRMMSNEETRCAKIAGFVADGIKGEELEVAVKQWEGDRRMGKDTLRPSKSRPSRVRGPSSVSTHVRSHSYSTSTAQPSTAAGSDRHYDDSSTGSTPTLTQTSRISKTSDVAGSPSESGRSNSSIVISPLPTDVPLTHMFKRSLSAPAPNTRLPYPLSPSEPSDESSAEEISPSTAESRGETWGPFRPLVLQEAPARTHNHARRDTVAYPLSSSSATGTFDRPQHLTWQEAENQRRIEEMQEPDSWWTNQRSPAESNFGYGERPEQRNVNLTTGGMGYENRDGSHFDRGYLEQYGSFDASQDGSQNVEWTNTSNSNSGRQGLVTLIEDPYKDDCNNPSPISLSSPTSFPPMSNSYYFSPVSPVTPTIPSSSFSTLTGWAGDYKHQTSNVRTWPAHNTVSKLSSSSNWYDNEGGIHWDASRRELQHPGTALDGHDWNRLEYRAASELHLEVEPPRQMNFHDEIRRMHGPSS